VTGMRIDMRDHPKVREQVHAGLSALRVQGRQIWGESRHPLGEIVVRLMVGVGDLARLARDHVQLHLWSPDEDHLERRDELKKELGNIIFSTIRWCDDLGLDVMECLELAIEAQETFAQSGRTR